MPYNTVKMLLFFVVVSVIESDLLFSNCGGNLAETVICPWSKHTHTHFVLFHGITRYILTDFSFSNWCIRESSISLSHTRHIENQNTYPFEVHTHTHAHKSKVFYFVCVSLPAAARPPTPRLDLRCQLWETQRRAECVCRMPFECPWVSVLRLPVKCFFARQIRFPQTYLQ